MRLCIYKSGEKIRMKSDARETGCRIFRQRENGATEQNREGKYGREERGGKKRGRNRRTKRNRDEKQRKVTEK